MTMWVDIDYRKGGLASRLSNLCNYPFELDGVEHQSMEGFLQSLKFERDSDAEVLRKMYGGKCFIAGQKGNSWKLQQILYFNGQPYGRSSKEYAHLINSAYDALYAQNETFRKAIYEARNYELRHDMGKFNMQDSVLTQVEYLFNLYRLQNRARAKAWARAIQYE